MALSDRIALLRSGRLEQVAEPREIYGHPRTAYVAQFIGQTNLLRAEVRDGVATAGAIAWPSAGPSGPAMFSLRPEAIRLASGASASPSVATATFHGHIRNQTFGGAMDLLEIDCGNSQTIRARVPSPGAVNGQQKFEFNAGDAVRVQEGSEA
jgi:ABC-type Fe3+/spermidine/putrescine transport system ATPase subunit